MSPIGPADERPAPATAAFLGLDRTLISGTSLSLLFRDLRHRDVIPLADVLALMARHAAATFFGGREEQLAELRRQTLAAVAGRQRDELSAWARTLATTEVLPRVYPDIAQIVARHRRAGNQIWLLTASPVELAQPIADVLELDGALGTVAETDGRGNYTGRLPHGLLHGADRLAAVRALAEEKGIALERSHAYSDSFDDGELLDSVGFPHAVNPEPRLLEKAVRRGWAVHELRPARRQLLVGVPPVVPVAGLVGIGALAGWAAGRRASSG